MARSLTLEEAEKVSDQAKEEGSRPQYFSVPAGGAEEISKEFETFLIITPATVKSQIASFFQVILDNDPNENSTRDELLTEFLLEELDNETERIRLFDNFAEFYDEVREAYAASVDGFTDVAEVALLQEAITRSLGSISDQRDAHQFNYAVYSVLTQRKDADDPDSFEQELRAWIRVLSTYD